VLNTKEQSAETKAAQDDPTAALAPLSAIFEASLYTDDLPAADAFYGDVLGLTKIFEVPGRQLVFRCGDGVLLIFDPRRTETERIEINGGAIPLHGARGAGHVAFRVTQAEFEPWAARLKTAGVAIESEVRWPNGAISLYFRDPVGNSLELATPNLWYGLAEGKQ
jgi:catechol 2,3-dioxygenase-like lactoylglutathione lyase family enzyme